MASLVSAAMDPLDVPVQRLDAELPVPKRMRAGDAAADLASTIDTVLAPGERQLIPTGFAIAVPPNAAGLVLSRSGLALKQGVAVLNAPGLIDSGYRGEIGVILVNHGAEPVAIERGQRIAQLMVVDAPAFALTEVDELPPAPDDRGVAGFGSSGA